MANLRVAHLGRGHMKILFEDAIDPIVHETMRHVQRIKTLWDD